MIASLLLTALAISLILKLNLLTPLLMKYCATAAMAAARSVRAMTPVTLSMKTR